MNKTEFKKHLKENGISFKEENKKISITGDNGGSVDLHSLVTLPEGVEFHNGGSVYLHSLVTLPEGVEFHNGGSVYLHSPVTLPEGVEFHNGGHVNLHSLVTLPEGVEFHNGGHVYLHSLGTSLPEGVEFHNGGNVYLNSLVTLPEGVEFHNGGHVNLHSLVTLPEGVEFHNGGSVYLSSLVTLPEGVEFHNGGSVDLKNERKEIKTPYLERFKVETKKNKVYLYKRVSKDFKTQEGTENETLWKVGSTVDHPAWKPETGECGPGKFHACAFPHWCSSFRSTKGDKFIKIEVDKKDLYEWTEFPNYPQKIAFKKAKVIKVIK